MPSYTIITTAEDGDYWHAEVRASDGTRLIDREGDTESEAITIAVVELLGDLPADFPPTLIAGGSQ